MIRLSVLSSALALFTCLATSACIDTFDGTKMELLISGGTPLPGATSNGAPPSGTHLELYLVRDDASFHALNFALMPVVDTTAPCYIEVDAVVPGTERDVSGLHSAHWYDKLLEVYLEDGEVDGDEAGNLADARARVTGIHELEEEVVAVVATSNGPPYDDDLLQADIDALVASLPAADAIDDESNRQRLAVCQDFFAARPNYYVGSDRLITRPINGVSYGVADGKDPRSGGFIGGANVDLEPNAEFFDAMRINWQFDDPADPRADALGNSAVGYHFMAGTPEQRVRGVTNISLRNNAFSSISAEAAIIVNLDEGGGF